MESQIYSYQNYQNLRPMLTQAHLTFASVFDKQNCIKCLSLTQSVTTNPYASNSVLLSLATHVTFKFPFLNIFNHFEKKCPQINPQINQVNEYLTYHPLFQPWCEFFSQAITKNHAIRKGNTLYIVLNLSNEQMSFVMSFKQKLSQFIIEKTQNWVQIVLKKVSGFKENEQLPRKKTKVTYLNVSGSQLRTDPYLPVPNVKPIVMGQLYSNENWSSFNILKDQIPSFEHFLETDIVIIPGSTNSVLSQIPQITKMKENLFKAFDANKKLKIFGICYGHQMIAQKYNGLVVRKQRTDKLQKYIFDQVTLDKLKEKITFLQKMVNYKKNSLLLQHHEDYVQEVSNQFYNLASSETSKVQCLVHNLGRMLSFQSHPQFLLDFSQGFLSRLSKYTQSPISIKLKYNNSEEREIHIESSMGMRAVVEDFFAYQVVE